MATQASKLSPLRTPSSSYEEFVNPQWVALLNILDMNVRYERCAGSELFTEDGRRITPNRLAPLSVVMDENVGAEQAAVSPDHQSVGWLALFENCCTSYPLPLKLVILHNGQFHSLEGYSAIWFWSFHI